MAIMFGNGTLKEIGGDKLIMKSEQFTATADGDTASDCGWSAKFTAPDGKLYDKKNAKFYDGAGATVTTFSKGVKYLCSYDLEATGSVIEISANSFPGTYYCVGDTYVRNQTTGEDEFFQIIVPRAKVQSENTITMEADGDPSTFNMNLRVMRGDDGSMMKLVQYELSEGETTTETATVDLVHNHVLNTNNMDDLTEEEG
jgi:hypothetical protein